MIWRSCAQQGFGLHLGASVLKPTRDISGFDSGLGCLCLGLNLASDQPADTSVFQAKTEAHYWAELTTMYSLNVKNATAQRYQLMRRMPPMRACRRITCRWIAFFSSSTVAFCITTTAAKQLLLQSPSSSFYVNTNVKCDRENQDVSLITEPAHWCDIPFSLGVSCWIREVELKSSWRLSTTGVRSKNSDFPSLLWHCSLDDKKDISWSK